MKKTLFLLSIFISLSTAIQASGAIRSYTIGIFRSAEVGVEYRVRAGIALGGTSPLPLPAEIRSIEGFNPGLNLSIEGEVFKIFNNSRWGLSTGLRLETQGMETEARVKGYSMTLTANDGGQMSGFFFGRVTTAVNNSFLTLPILGVWKPAERWGVKFGVYGSYALRRSFSGSAFDGYIREGTPVGNYVEIGTDNPALYDFSSYVRRWHWGLQVGGEWRAFPHLIVSADLTWGMNSIFPQDFETVAFRMFPIYGRLSFGYAF